MAILGNSTYEATSPGGFDDGRMVVSKHTLASASIMSELHAWFNGGDGSTTARIVLYADSSGTPGARLAYTNALACNGSLVERSQSGFSVSLPAGDYWLGFRSGINWTGDGRTGGGTGGTSKRKSSGAADPPPDPFPSPDVTGTQNLSVWAVVTAAAVAPVADFSATPLSGAPPLEVDFVDESTNTPTSWAWDFGDGDTDTVQDPTHEYAAAGTYTVELVATNAGGSDTETKTDYVTVSVPSPTGRFEVAFSDDTLEPSPTWTRLDE